MAAFRLSLKTYMERACFGCSSESSIKIVSLGLARYWMVGLDAVSVNDKVIQGLQADGAIMDTGTSLITASAADAATINAVRARIYFPF